LRSHELPHSPPNCLRGKGRQKKKKRKRRSLRHRGVLFWLLLGRDGGKAVLKNKEKFFTISGCCATRMGDACEKKRGERRPFMPETSA